jgi:poly-gamma-glutamate synthesis protein (capsule biosynthesis protein)
MSFKIAFLGDISLNGEYKTLADKGINPFKSLKGELDSSEFVVGNLEAVCEHSKGEHHAKQTRLSVDPKSLALLKYLNLNLVTLANNHIFDNLYDGFSRTIQFLQEEGIDYIGASLADSSPKFFVLKTQFCKIVFLNYVHSGTNPGVSEKDSIDLNHYDKRVIIETVRLHKKMCDYVVLILHWGMDNSRYPEPWQRKDARSFVDAGADLIVGHHSHVLQGYEKINGSFVFYSLGNFAFAPLRSGNEYELDPGRQQDSVILYLTVNNRKRNIDIRWQPIKLKKLYVGLSSNTNLKKISRKLPFISNKLVWPIYSFYLNTLYKFYYYFFGCGRNPITQLRKIDKKSFERAKSIIGLNGLKK